MFKIEHDNDEMLRLTTTAAEIPSLIRERAELSKEMRQSIFCQELYFKTFFSSL